MKAEAITTYALETHTLPSGIRVRIQVKADPRRPWEINGAGDNCVVRRERRGDSSTHEYFRGGRPLPLVIDEKDALVLVHLLNSARSLRPPRIGPTTWI